MVKIKSGIVWQGQSPMDGSPIVAIALATSRNTKTGDMVQTYIIRADIDPIAANRNGDDYAICGDCPSRGTANPSADSGLATGRSCYVNLGQGPRVVFKAFKEGKYSQLSEEQISALGVGRMVRLGTYGDPAMVPAEVWNTLTKQAKGQTGYTHQSNANIPQNPRLMVSADTATEAIAAHKKNLRTFRVISIKDWEANNKKALLTNEILCPASKEAGERVQCAECGLCDGVKRAKSVAIVAHGPTKNNHK